MIVKIYNTNLMKIFREYSNSIDSENGIDENGIKYLKKIILEDLEKDKSWKTCIKCRELYENNEIKFEDIIYILPNLDHCLDHV